MLMACLLWNIYGLGRWTRDTLSSPQHSVLKQAVGVAMVSFMYTRCPLSLGHLTALPWDHALGTCHHNAFSVQGINKALTLGALTLWNTCDNLLQWNLCSTEPYIDILHSTFWLQTFLIDWLWPKSIVEEKQGCLRGNNLFVVDSCVFWQLGTISCYLLGQVVKLSVIQTYKVSERFLRVTKFKIINSIKERECTNYNCTKPKMAMMKNKQ